MIVHKPLCIVCEIVSIGAESDDDGNFAAGTVLAFSDRTDSVALRVLVASLGYIWPRRRLID